MTLAIRAGISLIVLVAVFSTPLPAQSVSGEIAVSSPQLTAADHSQLAPSVATDGELFLVAWTNSTTKSEIYATRVSRDGAPLDETPLSIAVPPRAGANPRVVWTGQFFVVVWSSLQEIRATKISRDGEIVGEESIASGVYGSALSASCTSTRCLVA